MSGKESEHPERGSKKQDNLDPHKEDGQDQKMTTNQGVGINDNQNTLKAGERGASLMEDFIFREKMTHFDHERITTGFGIDGSMIPFPHKTFIS